MNLKKSPNFVWPIRENGWFGKTIVFCAKPQHNEKPQSFYKKPQSFMKTSSVSPQKTSTQLKTVVFFAKCRSLFTKLQLIRRLQCSFRKNLNTTKSHSLFTKNHSLFTKPRHTKAVVFLPKTSTQLKAVVFLQKAVVFLQNLNSTHTKGIVFLFENLNTGKSLSLFTKNRSLSSKTSTQLKQRPYGVSPTKLCSLLRYFPTFFFKWCKNLCGSWG